MSPLPAHLVFPGAAAAPASAPAAAAAADRALPGERVLGAALLLTLVLATFEGPLRYGLNLVHLDAAIFARDAILIGALAFYIASRGVAASVLVFFTLAAVHSAVSVANLGTAIGAVYGLKLFLPALCAFLVPQALLHPGPRALRLMALLWIASLAGATLDKFWLDYPWVGLNVDLGGVSVAIGRDWQSTALERVGGLTRSSINLAVIMPLLSLVLLTAVKSRVLRAVLCAATLTVLVWTTQKGAILGYGLAIAALALSNARLLLPLKAGVVIAAVALVFAPAVLIHFSMPRDQGVFSFESLFERIEWMWPAAWEWIGRFPAAMGVGLGGIGGAQRFYAPADFNPADNLFVFAFANFGVASLAYLAAVVATALNATARDFRRDAAVLASLVFILTYGLVISLVEDQIASLWLGAVLGWLARLQATRGQRLST